MKLYGKDRSERGNNPTICFEVSSLAFLGDKKWAPAKAAHEASLKYLAKETAIKLNVKKMLYGLTSRDNYQEIPSTCHWTWK